MTEVLKQQSVEPLRADERVAPNGGPTPTQARPEHTEQVVESRAGVEQRERVVTGHAGVEHRERSLRDTGAEQRLNRLRVAQIIWLFFGIVEGLIGLRVLLKLIGANPANDFANFVYNAAALFLAPFFGLIGSPSAGDMVLEIPSLVAMLVYALLGWMILRVISQFFFPPTTRSTSTYDRYPSENV
jgi:YggT family protein